MKRLLACLFVLPASALLAYEYGDFTAEQQEMLQKGQTLLWTYQDEQRDMHFTCAAILLEETLADTWALFENKEASPGYLEGLEESRVVEQEEGGTVLVYQETKPSAVTKGLQYVVRHRPVPFERLEFERVRGDLRHIEGAWHFDAVEGVDGGLKTLLVYELHVDPGRLLPQAIVVRSQKKRLPEVMEGVRARLAETRASREEERPQLVEAGEPVR